MPIQSIDRPSSRTFRRASLRLFAPALLLAHCLAQVPRAEAEVLSELAQKARNALLSDRYDEAINLYRRLAKALPAESGVRLNLAMALHSAGRYKESVAELERLKVPQTRNPRFWFLLGEGYLKLEQPGKAIEPLQRSVQLDTSYTLARVEFAAALLENGSLEKAEAAFRSLAKDAPELPKAWQGLAVCRLELSRAASAALIAQAPESSFRYALAALAESGKGNSERANAFYRKAQAALPSAPWLQAEMQADFAAKSEAAKAGSEIGLGANTGDHHPLAIAFFHGELEHMLEVTLEAPRDPEALYWKSRAYAELARIAVEQLSRLPPSAEQHELLAVALGRMGRRGDAISEWREASSMSPADLRIRGELARALRLDRQYDDALPLLEVLTQSDPTRAQWQYELGACLLGQGHPEQAMGPLQHAVNLRPAALEYRALLGQVLLQSGNLKSAAIQLERALPLDRDGSIHFQLASAYRGLGRLELAREATLREKQLRDATVAEGLPATAGAK